MTCVKPMTSPLYDIKTEADVAQLVNRFYERVRQDALLAPVFEDVAQVNWPTHLPKIVAFWSTMLLGEGDYRGNPMRPHFELAFKTSFTPGHFSQWLSLFEQTLTENFSGERADEALIRAKSIAMVMQGRLEMAGLLAQ